MSDKHTAVNRNVTSPSHKKTLHKFNNLLRNFILLHIMNCNLCRYCE